MIKRLIAALLLVAFAVAAAALPSVDEVQAQVKRGNYAEAEVMMQDVIAAKPGSARAHYIYAEILAHNQRYPEAAKQAALARQIDPAIGFADPLKFRSFEQLLERGSQAREQPGARPGSRAAAQTPMQPAPTQPARNVAPGGGIPGWVWIAGLALVGFVGWKMLRRRSSPSTMDYTRPVAPAMPAAGYGPGAATGPGYGQPGGYGPGAAGYPQATPAGGRGGLMGMGLAAAGGVAAGMLAEKMLHGHDAAANPAAGHPGSSLAPGQYADPGFDAGTARELEQRPIDFGSGDGWGDGGGGASDGGGGGDGDGW